MIIDYQRAYHQGVRVADIDVAMEELGTTLGVEWCDVQEREQRVWLPGVGATSLALKFTYSRGGPQHIELLQGPKGSIWDGSVNPGLHHIGVWSDDVAADTTAMLAARWSLQLAQVSPEDGYGAYTYVQPPSGLLVELVWSAIRPRFERWWAGGSLA